jgi:phage portal protein BeeE
MVKYGLQAGKHFFGYTKDAMTQGFTENRESGMPYMTTGTNFRDILAMLNNEYTDRTLIELFESVAEIYSPIYEIVSRAASGVFEFVNTETEEVIYGNPNLDKLLEQPNPLQNFKELFAEAGCYELLLGKNFLLSNTPSTLPRVDYKNIISSFNLPADVVTIKTAERIKLFSAQQASDIIQGYTLDKGTDNEITFPTNNVLHRKATNLSWIDKKLKGKAPVLSARRAIANLIAVYEARGVIYIKRGKMGAWVSRKSDDSGMVALTDVEKKQAVKDLDDNYGLQRNKQTVGITGVPVDFVKSSMSIAEMLPFDETKADASAIYAVCGVPDELMPGNDNGTYENKRTASVDVYRNRSIPFAESFCASLNKFWGLNVAKIRLRSRFDHIEVLQWNQKQKAEINALNGKTWLNQFQIGVITMNDVLAQSGYETVSNPLYKKLIYDMTPEEFAKVKDVLSLLAKSSSSNNNNNQQENPNPAQ